MRDDIQGGVLAMPIAALLMIVCCGDDGIALFGIIGAVGGWISGAEGLVAVMLPAMAALAWHNRRRTRTECCELGIPPLGNTGHERRSD